jgi:hypothetical protein
VAIPEYTCASICSRGDLALILICFVFI